MGNCACVCWRIYKKFTRCCAHVDESLTRITLASAHIHTELFRVWNNIFCESHGPIRVMFKSLGWPQEIFKCQAGASKNYYYQSQETTRAPYISKTQQIAQKQCRWMKSTKICIFEFWVNCPFKKKTILTLVLNEYRNSFHDKMTQIWQWNKL